MLEHITVVGASLAGVRAAEALRSEGFADELTLMGAEPHFPPYDRPPLPTKVLAGTVPEVPRLRIRDDLGVKLQFVGRPTGAVRIVEGSPAERRFVAIYGDGRWLHGILCANPLARVNRYCQMIASKGSSALTTAGTALPD